MDQLQTPPHSPPPPQMPSSWPVSLGVVGLIFGLGGFCLYAMQALQTWMYMQMGPSGMFGSAVAVSGTGADNEVTAAMEESMKTMMEGLTEMSRVKIFADGAMVILALVLFIGAVMLMLRYRLSRMILLFWSGAKILVGLFSVYQMRKMMMVMSQSMAGFDDQIGASGGAPPSFNLEDIYTKMGSVMMVIGAVWISILPVLFLIWLNRDIIKEDIANGYGWK